MPMKNKFGEYSDADRLDHVIEHGDRGYRSRVISDRGSFSVVGDPRNALYPTYIDAALVAIDVEIDKESKSER